MVHSRRGFTLIEMSMVLVIIGLVVGGVLVGQSLVSAAAVRAQISQIEKYNQAANTFREKYGYLPGDIPAIPAAQFGFAARGQYAGEGDGNGVIEGISSNAPNSNAGYIEGGGETAMFWADLSQVGLLDTTLNTASATAPVYAAYSNLPPSLRAYLPNSKIGTGSIAVASRASTNYFAIAAIGQIGGGYTYTNGFLLTVAQAYSIDLKIDDGLPTSGNVTAEFLSASATGFGWSPGYPYVDTGRVSQAVVGGGPTTCFDNGGTNSVAFVYSMSQNNGTGLNCSLLWKMQAGD